MRITGRTLFIPGATSGIGLALALALHDAGSTVIIGGRRTDLLDRITAEHPGLHAYPIDIADPASITEVSARVIAEHPDLDVLITMAGIMRAEDWTHPGGFLGTAEQIVTTNVLGPIRLIAAFVEHLRTRPEAAVVTVSSGLAHVPLAATPTYNATKAAVHRLTESIRLQLAGTSVEVLEIVPPEVATDLMPGQRESATAMPLDAFVTETVELLARPGATEILVDRVRFLREAEIRGDYPQVVATLNGAGRHSA